MSRYVHATSGKNDGLGRLLHTKSIITLRNGHACESLAPDYCSWYLYEHFECYYIKIYGLVLLQSVFEWNDKIASSRIFSKIKVVKTQKPLMRSSWNFPKLIFSSKFTIVANLESIGLEIRIPPERNFFFWLKNRPILFGRYVYFKLKLL